MLEQIPLEPIADLAVTQDIARLRLGHKVPHTLHRLMLGRLLSEHTDQEVMVEASQVLAL